MRWWPSRPAADPTGALTADDVRWAYGELLGRDPLEEEVAGQLAATPDLRGLVAAIAASPEHRSHVVPAEAPSPLPHVVNTWHPELAPFTHPPGLWSQDGVTVVGREGWLFLGGGSNAVLDQYRGTFTLPDGWAERWAEAVRVRREQTAALGAGWAGLIVPDKLRVLAEHFPEALPADARPPAAVLAADPGLEILYPVDELRAVAGGAFLRTDSHLTYGGNAALAQAVLTRLGVEVDVTGPVPDPLRYVTVGDLGDRLLPPAIEIVTAASTFGAATLVQDNHDEIAAAGGHLGNRRVLRNEQAPDGRTAVVFGDSYAFPAPHYQGLAWFLAQVFREVHSLWVPFGWDRRYAEEAGAGVVVFQAAERFVVRPPALEHDVHDIARQTLAGRRGITIEELDQRVSEPT
jgi:alginate O-acetyltransferase complex protein AlgJ